MIPDDSKIFNHHAVPRFFDDHETQLQHHFGQDAPPTLDGGGGRHLLCTCPVCKHTWYKAGKREYVRLTPEQLCHLGATLHADTRTPHSLPRTLCPICSTVFLDGIFTIESYPAHPKDYHFTWESALPSRRILLAMLCQRDDHDPAAVARLVRMVPDALAISMREVYPALSWLAGTGCAFPASPVRPYSDEEGWHLAQRLHPGRDAGGISRLWQGYSWEAHCPPLGGRSALISLAVTVRPGEPTSFAQVFTAWKQLARAMRAVL